MVITITYVSASHRKAGNLGGPRRRDRLYRDSVGEEARLEDLRLSILNVSAACAPVP
jgi:hypothetical protein